MRSLLSKTVAATVALFLVIGFLAIPSASAQDYPPPAVGAVNCDSLPAPTIAIVGTDVVVTLPQGSLTCIIRVVVEINPTLYDGPPPVSGVLTLPIPALEGDDHTATVTAFSTFGVVKGDSVKVSASALAAARASFAATTGAGDSATTAAANPAVAVAVVPQAQGLAVTGSDVNLPLATAATLVGAGGLMLLAARKRERKTV